MALEPDLIANGWKPIRPEAFVHSATRNWKKVANKSPW